MLKLIFICYTFLVIGDVVHGIRDYGYYKSANGWLKLHQVPATWQDAFSTCNAEGAVLASPLNYGIWNILRTYTLIYKLDRPVYLGVNALNSNGEFVSIEGVPLDNMPDLWGSYGNGSKPGSCLTLNPDSHVYTSSCLEYFPFICYKKMDQTTKFNECGTFDDGYQLNATTGSCYKLHKERKLWSEAQKICIAEGSHLVALNDHWEAEIIVDLWPQKESIFDNWNPLTHVGLLDWNRDFTWMTTTGQKIENVYNKWAEGKPDGKGENLCACLLQDGTLDNFKCSTVSLQFTCEKNPNTSQFERV